MGWPILGTAYTGTHLGEVIDAADTQRLRLAIISMRSDGPPTRWSIDTQLAAQPDGTLISVNLNELDTAKRSHRVLSYLLHQVIKDALRRC